MDGETITAVTITATVNIVTIISMIYYLKGKVETMEKSLNQRINDLRDSLNKRIDDIYRVLNKDITTVNK
ncbi:MAG: hypothetical protein DRO14_05500 [Thermoprotei archaeon]|nr:MAG: hypothetical protein DRO14_05500 [Thermoprotei archaeon]